MSQSGSRAPVTDVTISMSPLAKKIKSSDNIQVTIEMPRAVAVERAMAVERAVVVEIPTHPKINLKYSVQPDSPLVQSAKMKDVLLYQTYRK